MNVKPHLPAAGWKPGQRRILQHGLVEPDGEHLSDPVLREAPR
jgi:hypothetical protein